MERLARLLPFRQFGRLRHLRGLADCAARNARATAAALSGSLFEAADYESAADASVAAADHPPLPSAQPAFARVSLNSGLNHAEPDRRAPVRVYHGPSRLIMVGSIDAVCRMIDRCIAEQGDPAALAR